LTQPVSPVSRGLNRWFLGRLVPALAYLSTGSADARRMMDYFRDTIESCVPPEAILEAMAAAGFSGVTRAVTGGVLSEYVATAA
jgi:demethylmenaquinone methyltransferase/2-methoxy-6-polyprenyl-1,4-benzoquinol methylase